MRTPAFQLFKYVGYGFFRSKKEQDMHMVGNAPDAIDNAIQGNELLS